ncbi:MAG: nuclease-related domain-containing protein [Proteobacteria bacterium]|nr:nuclease-related domain-containing protein [Pseudomonadota bacterium]
MVGVGDVHPRQAPRTRVSRAEVAVWEALRRGLPSGWRAWHSLRLRVGNHWEGEGDFVIAAPDRGLLVLEVKGGAMELRDGRWFQNGRELDRAPRQQALDFVKKLVGALRDRGIETPAYGVACAFPDVDFSDDLGPRAGDLADLVVGPRQLQWIEQALPALLARAVPDHPPHRATSGGSPSSTSCGARPGSRRCRSPTRRSTATPASSP